MAQVTEYRIELATRSDRSQPRPGTTYSHGWACLASTRAWDSGQLAIIVAK